MEDEEVSLLAQDIVARTSDMIAKPVAELNSMRTAIGMTAGKAHKIIQQSLGYIEQSGLEKTDVSVGEPNERQCYVGGKYLQAQFSEIVCFNKKGLSTIKRDSDTGRNARTYGTYQSSEAETKVLLECMKHRKDEIAKYLDKCKLKRKLNIWNDVVKCTSAYERINEINDSTDVITVHCQPIEFHMALENTDGALCNIKIPIHTFSVDDKRLIVDLDKPDEDFPAIRINGYGKRAERTVLTLELNAPFTLLAITQVKKQLNELLGEKRREMQLLIDEQNELFNQIEQNLVTYIMIAKMAE